MAEQDHFKMQRQRVCVPTPLFFLQPLKVHWQCVADVRHTWGQGVMAGAEGGEDTLNSFVVGLIVGVPGHGIHVGMSFTLKVQQVVVIHIQPVGSLSTGAFLRLRRGLWYVITVNELPARKCLKCLTDQTIAQSLRSKVDHFLSGGLSLLLA